MDLLLHLRAFARTAELGGFSAAARALNLSQPAISRQVADLEARLGSRLLHRSSTGVTLTAEGRAFLDAAQAALDAADAALASVGTRRGALEGLVRLGCPVAFGRLEVVPRLAALFARHPGLAMDLVLADGFADLVQDALDATIRVGRVADPGLIIRRIGVTLRGCFASPAYLDRFGTPQHPADLARHDVLHFSGLAAGETWPLDGPGGHVEMPLKARFRANSSEAIRAACLAGMGIALSPFWLFRADLAAGTIVPVLPDWRATPLPIQVVFPSRRQVPARVRAVVEHLADEFRLDPVLSDYGVT